MLHEAAQWELSRTWAQIPIEPYTRTGYCIDNNIVIVYQLLNCISGEFPLRETSLSCSIALAVAVGITIYTQGVLWPAVVYAALLVVTVKSIQQHKIIQYEFLQYSEYGNTVLVFLEYPDTEYIFLWEPIPDKEYVQNYSRFEALIIITNCYFLK